MLIFIGTTGPPKGVMCSQDNLVWAARFHSMNMESRTFIAYLPMNHIAGQIALYYSIATGGTLYFARPDALQGSLIETLIEVRDIIRNRITCSKN